MSRRSALTTLLLMLSVAAHTARSEPAATRTDHHGDPLPPGAVARLGTVRLRHVGGIRALAFSPDGKRLASGSDARNDDRTLRLWDVRTGKEIFRRTDSGRSFVRIAFSPDGKTLATGGDHGNVILWDAGTGKRRRDLSVDQSSIDELAFTPDGRRLIVGGEGQGIGLWDVSTGKELKQLQGSFSTVALSHDGKTLAAVGPKQSLQFWDVAIGTERKHLSDMKGRIRRIALSPDGKAIAFIGKDHTLRLLDVSTGKDIRPLKKNEACRDDVVFSPDEQFLAAGGKDSVRVWQLSSGDPLPPFRNARLESCAFAFSPDSKVLAVTDIDHVIHFWELSTGKDLSPVGEEPAEARSLSFSADGATVSMRSGEWSLDQWETASWIKRRRFRLPFTEARPEEVCLVASPDGKTVASSSAEAVIHLHDWATGRERAVLRHRTPVSNVQFSGDGRLLISWSGAKARLWETATGRAIQSFSYRDGPPGAFTSEGAFSLDGKVWLTGLRQEMTLRFWDISTGRVWRRFNFPAESVPDVLALSADLQILATSNEYGPTRVWRIRNGKEFIRLKETKADGMVKALAFSPDGRSLAAVYRQRERPANLMAAGRNAYRREIDSIQVWELVTGEARQRFRADRHDIHELMFSPDGRLLASARRDTTALVWDLAGAHSPSSRPAPRTEDEWAKMWADLAAEDGARAFAAINALAAQPRQAVPWLRRRMRPVPQPDARRLASWIADLDSDNFDTRQRASHALTEVVEPAEPALRKTLAGRPSLEVRRRVEQILAPLTQAMTPDRLRVIRALEALERIGTDDARRLLEELVGGAPAALQTREAKASLERLTR